MKNKKRVIKKWVYYTIILINFINIVLCSGEWASFKMQLLFMLYSGLILFASYKIIEKFGGELQYDL